jgi:chromosome segregation protein SMC
MRKERVLHMHLKALELAGFKSFAEKTTVEFNRGITSIVGPNGSGKSNILDAILWVLGEQSYKNIRAKESSDIIFSGGKNKKPRSMAEVSLIIENEDRYLDIDFSEVKITRRIYKSGENEYFINNRRVRLKDISNLFMDTGIGKQAYSIIGQGRVERIISSNPRELREIIEEAAGVKRAKVEKEDSTKKLKEVKNEIEKIEFVEKELATRVGHLREEERKARLYKTFSEKIDTHKLMILEYNQNEGKRKQEEFEVKRSQLEKVILEIQKEYEAKNAEAENISISKKEKYELLENEKNANELIFLEMETFRDEYAKLSGQLSNLDIQAEEKEKRNKVLEKDIKEKGEILSKSEKELSEIVKELSEKEKSKNKIEEKVEELKVRRELLTTKLKKATQQSHDFEVDKIKATSENEENEKRIATAEIVMKRQVAEKEDMDAEFSEFVSRMKVFEQNKLAKENEKKEKELILKEADAKAEKIRRQYSDINKDLGELSYRYENLNAKKRANENIIEKNETFARATKGILQENIKGVIGAFVNLINIPDGYEEAIQTLSGGNFQDIVVENSDIGKKCIAILKDKKLGRASFLPVADVKVYKILNEYPKKEGVMGFARNIVECDERIKKIVDFVYGNSIVVKNIEIGTQLLKEGFSDRIVTLEGDIITARGRMTGGYSVRGKDELLERKKELKVIKEKMNEIQNEREELSRKLEKLSEILKTEEKKREKIQKELEVMEGNYREFLKEYDNFNSEYNKRKREIETLEYEIKQNRDFIASRKEKIKENSEIIENIVKLIEENKLAIVTLNNEIEKSENINEYYHELNTIDKEYEILKVKTDSNKSRYAEIKADYEKLVNEKKEVEEFQQKKTVMKEKLTKAIQNKKEEIEGKQKENTEKSQLIKSLEKEIKNLEVSEKELIKGVKDIEIKKRDQENEYGKLIEKISENEKKMETYNSELEEISEERAKNSEEYKEIDNETELQAVKRKLSVNERSRTEIGSVNLSAIEEYEKENKRYTELVNQKKDLLASRESLLTLIGDIENDIIEKFNIALEEINNNFKYMCETILNGAKGAIRLLDEENMLETGLELSVKYKNKPEQTLMLLSGGEKSMLAVSFIMAIFMFKPSPFTFFDEIEAALDEENTKKIVKLLNKFITKSQFILITHNKETMKGSHRLYGVTMNKEIGESRIISVDV